MLCIKRSIRVTKLTGEQEGNDTVWNWATKVKEHQLKTGAQRKENWRPLLEDSQHYRACLPCILRQSPLLSSLKSFTWQKHTLV